MLQIKNSKCWTQFLTTKILHERFLKPTPKIMTPTDCKYDIKMFQYFKTLWNERRKGKSEKYECSTTTSQRPSFRYYAKTIEDVL